MPTLFLDFDGVLYDTLKEAYVLCRYVCHNIDFFAPIEQDIYAKFYKYKYLVYNSWQYLYLTKAISSKDVVAKYNELLQNRDLGQEQEFEEKYLSSRKWLLENHADYVDSLESKFPFLKMVERLQDKYEILIVSRKNSFAIKRKNTGFKVFGKEELSNVVNKSEFIEKYMLDNKIKKAFFVDDNSHNLIPCQNIPNLTCFLAGWGNIAIDEKGLTQEEVYNELKEFVS